MISITPIPAFKDNYIWMITDNLHNAWVIDPGDAIPVIDKLKQESLQLKGILLTHHHHDHSGGIVNLVQYAGNIPVFGSHKSRIKSVSHDLKENNQIECGSISFSIIEIAGHTLDHIAFYGNNALFCGDTLFSAGCGKIFEGTPEQMYHSLQKISSLDINTKIYCGHEYTLSNLLFAQHVDPENILIPLKINDILQKPRCTLPTTLKEEQLINPFLRCTHAPIIQAVQNHTGKKLTNSIEVFYHLREWKNNFNP